MPQYVTDTQVKELLSTSINTQPFIQAAVVAMDGLLGDAGYTLAELTEIQRWLAAHFATAHVGTQGGQIRAESYQDYSVSYATAQLGDNLAATSYGMMVKQIEYKGFFATALGKQRASFSVH